MTIIAPSDFKAQNSIAQRETPPVAALIQEFIDKYEPMFLKKLLGLSLYNELTTGLATNPIDPKWTALRDDTEIKPMLVDYIYYWYLRNQTTLTGGVSELKPKAENAVPVSNVDKQVRAWNEMVLMARPFRLDVAVYPNYVRPNLYRYSYWFHGCEVSDIYFTINSLNI